MICLPLLCFGAREFESRPYTNRPDSVLCSSLFSSFTTDKFSDIKDNLKGTKKIRIFCHHLIILRYEIGVVRTAPLVQANKQTFCVA
jgi:hypothetical protein